MMKSYHLMFSAVLVLFLGCTMSIAGLSAIYAQAARPPAVQIVHVDTANYPQMAVALSGVDWPQSLESAPVTLTLNDQPLTLDADQLAQQGIQLALAIDTNQLVTRKASGQSGYVEMTGTLLDLVEANTFVRDEDWLAVYHLQGNAKPVVVQEWTQEPNLIFNSVVDNRPPEINDEPLTAAPLIELITQIANGPQRDAMRTALLLFSTGTTIADPAPIVEAAQAAQIAIYTVELLGTEGSVQSATLVQLATQTGGHYTALTRPELSTEVGDALTALHTVRILQTRATTSTPASLAVTVTLPDQTILSTSVGADTFADLVVTPVQVALINPTTAPISWNELATGDDGDRRLLPIKTDFTWTDGHPRELLQVSYTLRGPGGFAEQAIRTAAPFDQATFALKAVQAGDYSLEVRALDELTLAADVATVTWRFSDLPTVGSAQPTAVADNTVVSDRASQLAEAGRAGTASTAAEGVATNQQNANNTAANSAANNNVLIPGLQVAIPRALLVWSLPVLLLLIGYLIYSERRERRHHAQNRQQPLSDQQLPLSAANTPQFDLRDDSQPRPSSPYQLRQSDQQHARRYTLRADDSPTDLENADSKGAQRADYGVAPRPVGNPVAAGLPQQAVATAYPSGEALIWDDDGDVDDGDDDVEDEITFAPARMEDFEATYRTQEVARPVIGYLMRTTTDPNLPKELPIYSLNPAPGELRQIHIGRHSKHNTVVINDKRISREHAVIVQRDGRLYLRDNASTAGTFLNWKQLKPGEELLLRHNDLVSFGEIAYEFRAQGEDEATAHND